MCVCVRTVNTKACNSWSCLHSTIASTSFPRSGFEVLLCEKAYHYAVLKIRKHYTKVTHTLWLLDLTGSLIKSMRWKVWTSSVQLPRNCQALSYRFAQFELCLCTREVWLSCFTLASTESRDSVRLWAPPWVTYVFVGTTVWSYLPITAVPECPLSQKKKKKKKKN